MEAHRSTHQGENVMQTNTQKTRMLVALIAVAATAGIGATAQAADAAKASARYDSVVVQYSDLDLSGVAGNKVLYARLSAAAERACGKDPNSRDLQRRMQYRACYDSALNRAVDKIGSRELQALHATGAARNVG
jgi:UrcA family protein